MRRRSHLIRYRNQRDKLDLGLWDEICFYRYMYWGRYGIDTIKQTGYNTADRVHAMIDPIRMVQIRTIDWRS